MLIFPSPSSAMQRSSEENAIESISSGCWMSPSRVCVGVSQNVTTYTFRGGCDELAMPWQGNT